MAGPLRTLLLAVLLAAILLLLLLRALLILIVLLALLALLFLLALPLLVLLVRLLLHRWLLCMDGPTDWRRREMPEMRNGSAPAGQQTVCLDGLIREIGPVNPRHQPKIFADCPAWHVHGQITKKDPLAARRDAGHIAGDRHGTDGYTGQSRVHQE